MSREWNALGLSHRFLRQHVKAGDFAVDATAGNGGDTLFLSRLVGENGRVLAMDIQPRAIENTTALLRQNGAENVRLVLDGHQNMAAYAAEESADTVVFNFGWLPAGDHSIFTRKETSIPAVEAGLRLLRPGGAMSLCIYYGRDNGYDERDALLQYVRSLDDRAYSVMVIDFANRKNDPPIFVWIVKEG
jgi:Predicted S-adenosylmethionine-dependent methyltransferase involved in cell envelope biogenesis